MVGSNLLTVAIGASYFQFCLVNRFRLSWQPQMDYVSAGKIYLSRT